MPDPITRIIFRRGTELERRNGLILNQAEPGYTTDTKRLFIGDGVTVGGIPVGTKFLGFFNFGAISTAIPSALYPQSNDLAFDRTTNILYALTGANFALVSDWGPVGINIQADNTTIQRTIDTISLKKNSLDGSYFKTVAIGRGLERTGGLDNKETVRMADPGPGLVFNSNTIQVGTNSISNTMLGIMPPNTVKGKLTIAGTPEDITFATLANVLAPILRPIINPPFNPGVTPPRYAFTNGIFIDNNVDPSVFSIDSNYAIFNPAQIQFKKPVSCTGDITSSGSIVASGNITGAVGTLGTNGLGTRYVSTGTPSGGVDGDIWLQYQ